MHTRFKYDLNACIYVYWTKAVLFAVDSNNENIREEIKRCVTVFRRILPDVCVCVQTLKSASGREQSAQRTGREQRETEEVAAEEHDRVLGVFQLLRR